MAAPPTKIQQISLPELTINYNFKEVPRYDRCTTCHQGIDRLGYDKDADGKPMPTVFASHPHLTDGATTIDPKGQGGHGGPLPRRQRPAPDQQLRLHDLPRRPGVGDRLHLRLAHARTTSKQAEEWKEEHGWQEIHHWDEPMLPERFIESSCLKCHHQVTDIPQAKKLQAGYQRIVKYGCTGCHTIGGEGSFGPDLTDERPGRPEPRATSAPRSRRTGSLKWIKNPHAFRPDTRMPRFYGLTNNDAPGGLAQEPRRDPRDHPLPVRQEHARRPTSSIRPPRATRARARSSSSRRAAWPATQHRPYDAGEVQLADRERRQPRLQARPGRDLRPQATFPESVREYAKADFGPNLVEHRRQVPVARRRGYKWLANWIQAPEAYHPKSLMPNLQLSLQDAADIAALAHLGPRRVAGQGRGPRRRRPRRSRRALDELVKLYVTKGGYQAATARSVVVPLSEVDEFVEQARAPTTS